MDREQRNLLRRAAEKARKLLEREVADQLEGVHNILPDGTIRDGAPGDPGVRSRVLDVIAHHRAAGATASQAVERAKREMAFTILNRFAALKMCEQRGLVRECISKGPLSDGVRELADGAPGLRAAAEDGGYRLILEAIMDELSLGLKDLFDRRSSTGLIWPRPVALSELLDTLNAAELAGIWGEDETIGWIYQYFNPKEVREAMREASAAPRNSHELAVRNQFFTPRYVVEFLVDNTLGRLWYEMRGGNTILKTECRYLIRRPNEIFLRPGQTTPAAAEDESGLDYGDLLSRPYYIAQRPKKDPRAIKVLDPACGSGHFLLCAVGILERIYEEAWADPQSPEWVSTGTTLRQDFETIDSLRVALPKLIVENNLHGIEIDLRAAQIATLAIWLRAQKAWMRFGVTAIERPRIARTNIVTAEPMPGEKELRREFCAELKPPLLSQLVEVVFDSMELAGEAGSLLRIEHEIRYAVAMARQQWEAGTSAEEQPSLFDAVAPPLRDAEGSFDFSDIDNATFWTGVENRILEALEEYAKQSEGGHGARRGLFADDAARGFAFVDLCCKRYDVVLMNPPFGLGSKPSEKYLNSRYEKSGASELCATFYTRALEFLAEDCFFGAISSRTFYYLYSLKDWRRHEGFEKSTLRYWIDLGQGILDDAVNETAAYVVSKGRVVHHLSQFGMYHREEDKKVAVTAFVDGGTANYLRRLSDFERLPDRPLCYWVSNAFIRSLPRLRVFGDDVAEVEMGLAPRDEFRFSRLWWEVNPQQVGEGRTWVPYAKGGELSAYYSDVELLLKADKNLAEIKASLNQKYPYLNGNLSWVLHPENRYFEAGLTFGQRTAFLRVSVLPRGSYFSVAGKAIFGKSLSNKALLQLINTPSCQYLISLRREMLEINPQYQEGDVARMPWPDIQEPLIANLEGMAEENVNLVRAIASSDEVDHAFVRPTNPEEHARDLQRAKERIRLNEDQSDSEFQRLLGLGDEDRRFIDLEIISRWNARSGGNWYISHPVDHMQHAVGAVFGRWDVRSCVDASRVLGTGDPFEPLPLCSPGMLVSSDGLPAKMGDISDSSYPLRISWGGVLVNDLSSDGDQVGEDDIVVRVREALNFLSKEKAEQFEESVCGGVGTREVRDYFSRPSGFFQDHLKRYSKSRRKAPIYWPLSTPSGVYTVWLYYSRLTADTLYKVVSEHVAPKIGKVESRIAQLKICEAKGAGREHARTMKEQERLIELLAELKDMREELLRIAGLPYKPDLNDGVQITAAPLWRLFRLPRWRNELEKTWKALENGEYDWAHLAYAIWRDRINEKCKSDKSLAIAHGVESLYVEPRTDEAEAPKKRRKRRGGQ